MDLIRVLYTNSNDECHQLTTLWRHCVYNTWRSHRWQHAMKRDIDRKYRFFHTPPALDVPVSGEVPSDITVRFGAEKREWYGYPLWKTSSSALADRLRDASCLSVVRPSFNSTYVERNLLLLPTSASDLIYQCVQINSVLFSSHRKSSMLVVINKIADA